MKTYYIKKTDADNVPIDSPLWDMAEEAMIDLPTPDSTYSPNTTAKLLYSTGGITLRMETDEKPLVATYKNQNDPVFLDSCMEFFIGPENDERYLNFEINSLGTLLLGLGDGRDGRENVRISSENFSIECTFLNDKWQLKLFLSFEIIDKLFGSHTDTFYGNLFKCGDETGHEHYLAWSEVKLPKADFHHPEFFGRFILS